MSKQSRKYDTSKQSMVEGSVLQISAIFSRVVPHVLTLYEKAIARDRLFNG
jgi:hypothetical protein